MGGLPRPGEARQDRGGRLKWLSFGDDSLELCGPKGRGYKPLENEAPLRSHLVRGREGPLPSLCPLFVGDLFLACRCGELGRPDKRGVDAIGGRLEELNAQGKVPLSPGLPQGHCFARDEEHGKKLDQEGKYVVAGDQVHLNYSL